MADFDSKLPIRSLAADNTTEIADSTGATINPAEEFAQGSTTTGQKGPLAQAAVTTADPSYTDGTTAPLSLDASGRLRTTASFTPSGTQDVNITEVGGNAVTTTVPVSGTVTVVQPTGSNLHVDVDNFPATQPVSGTVTANQGTPNSLANGWPVEITDGTNVLGTGTHPMRVDPTGTTTQPVSGTVTANAGTGTFQMNEAQVAGTAVSVNTGNSDAGTQRVVLASDQPAVAIKDSSVETPQYNTASAVAANASNTQTYSPGSTVLLDGVDASASGQMKIEIQYGTTGSEATKAVFFTSKGNLQLQWRLPHPISITNTMSVKVIRTNMDNQAMDVYSTILVH